MPRRKRRLGGGRFTLPGTRPGNVRPPLKTQQQPSQTREERVILGAINSLKIDGPMVDIEYWSSTFQILFHSYGPDHIPVADASKILAAAARHSDTAAAAAVAESLRAYGPAEHRDEARDVLRMLIDSGASVPQWVHTFGDVKPLRAVMLTDSWGDHPTVWVDFERPDGMVRGVGMEIYVSQRGPMIGMEYWPSIEHLTREAEARSHFVWSDISLADARATMQTCMDLYDQRVDFDEFYDRRIFDKHNTSYDRYMSDLSDPFTIPLNDSIIGMRGIDIFERFSHTLRALVAQRMALLPPDGVSHIPVPPDEHEINDITREFSKSYADDQALSHTKDQTDDTQHVIRDIRRFASTWCEGDPLRWSPCRIAMYLTGWVPTQTEYADTYYAAVESVFPHWLRFAGEHRSIADELIESNIDAARRSFITMHTHAEDPHAYELTEDILKRKKRSSEYHEDRDDIVNTWFTPTDLGYDTPDTSK